MNRRKSKAIRKVALQLMEDTPKQFQNETIKHGVNPKRQIFGVKPFESIQIISGFRKAKRAAAAVY